MSDSLLRKKLIRLAHAKPELRGKLLPLLQRKTALFNPGQILKQLSQKIGKKYNLDGKISTHSNGWMELTMWKWGDPAPMRQRDMLIIQWRDDDYDPDVDEDYDAFDEYNEAFFIGHGSNNHWWWDRDVLGYAKTPLSTMLRDVDEYIRLEVPELDN